MDHDTDIAPALIAAVHTTHIHPGNTTDSASLQEALDGITPEMMAAVSGFLKNNPTIPAYVSRPDIKGKGLKIEIFIALDPLEPGEEGGIES